MPITCQRYLRMADLTTARMTALSPGASPPPVQMPIRRMSDMVARYGVTVSVAFAVKVDVLTYVAVTVTLFPIAAFAPEVIVTGSPWVTVKLVVSLTVQVAVDETS